MKPHRTSGQSTPGGVSSLGDRSHQQVPFIRRGPCARPGVDALIGQGPSARDGTRGRGATWGDVCWGDGLTRFSSPEVSGQVPAFGGPGRLAGCRVQGQRSENRGGRCWKSRGPQAEGLEATGRGGMWAGWGQVTHLSSCLSFPLIGWRRPHGRTPGRTPPGFQGLGLRPGRVSEQRLPGCCWALPRGRVSRPHTGRKPRLPAPERGPDSGSAQSWAPSCRPPRAPAEGSRSARTCLSRRPADGQRARPAGCRASAGLSGGKAGGHRRGPVPCWAGGQPSPAGLAVSHQPQGWAGRRPCLGVPCL